jgi:hypothetical protein
MPTMRTLLIPSALVAVFLAMPAAAEDCAVPPPLTAGTAPLMPIEPEQAVEPAKLAPLAADSPWRARFAAAADELLPALRSREPARWQPLLGGRWLGAAERQAVAALLVDRCAAFAPLFAASGPVERRIFGWSVPATYSAAERAEIAARPEAEALVCWAAGQGGEAAWPETAAQADNAAGRPYACARITYSLRGGTPSWRAFVERG